MMTRTELIRALKGMQAETGSLICLGCGHEHNCSTQGCAIIRAAAEELEKIRWVPVKYPPMEGQRCLVYTRHKEIIALVYEWQDCEDYDVNTFDVFDVKYWMPLPEPPEVTE